MTLRIAVCDDDANDLKAEIEMIRAVFAEKQLGCEYNFFRNSSELLSSGIEYDMAFLDIKMDGIDGIALSKKLMEKNKNCFVFFITNYQFYLDAAFDVGAFRFLTKPLDRSRLERGIDSALERIKDNYRIIRLTNWKNKTLVDIGISSVIYIENESRHTHVVSADYDFIAEEPFRTVKNLIEKEVTYFAQSHQSFYVNMRYVTHYSRQSVTLTYGDREYIAAMSRRQFSSFDKRFFMQAGEMR